MKKLSTFCVMIILCAIVSPNLTYGQYGETNNVLSQLRQIYLRNTYGVTTKQIVRYESVLAAKAITEQGLKAQVISSSQFERLAKVIYNDFKSQVSEIFTPAQYAQWKSSTFNSEWYRYLSEDLQIPIEKVQQLRTLRKNYESQRNTISSTTNDGKERYKLERANKESFKTSTKQLLGDAVANRYHYELLLYNAACKNMNKYGASYAQARKIAQIMEDFSVEKNRIVASDLRGESRSQAHAANKSKRDTELKKSLPEDVLARWEVINNNTFDRELRDKYQLSKEQLAAFKECYNRFAIQEYKILHSKSADKTTKWSEAYNAFCDEVKPLFKSDQYELWVGKAVYDFEQKKARKINQ